jgi:transcriptional regulator with XRE-family HTH domain
MSKRTTLEKKFLKDFGRRVQQLRTKAGLTQYELAEKIDVSQEVISRVECGHVGVKLSRLALMAQALDVKPKDLLNF